MSFATGCNYHIRVLTFKLSAVKPLDDIKT